MAKKAKKSSKNAVPQGKSNVGYGNPPDEYKFKPGQSGNPSGCPKSRVNLWRWICFYMEKTDAEIKKLNRGKLTQVQQTALTLVENAKDGKHSGSEHLMRYIVDRDLGKASEHIFMGREEDIPSDEECDEIRKLLRKKHGY